MLVFQLLLLFGCKPQIHNPSGDCEADGNGDRPGYHSSGSESTYLPDCKNVLSRELWRVFAVSESSAYVIPRPDSIGISYGICDGEDTDLATLFDTYGLCEEYGDPNIINDIIPADALLMTNTLHQLLRFEVDGSGMISPWAPDDDIINACDLTDNPDAQEYCDLLESRCDSSGDCMDIGYVPSQEAAEALVPALNELYGIE